MNTPQSTPLISIVVLAYNHEAYMAETLGSILMQEVDARLEVLIMEDCSTDGTRRIVEEFQQKHPDIIRLIAREKNVGGKQNLLDGVAATTGDFLAVLDGDDYWTDPKKLAQQLEVLNNNSTFAGCGHNTTLHHQNNDTPDSLMVPEKRKRASYSVKDFILGHIYLHSSSLLFRQVFKGGLPKAQHDVRVGDTFMCMLFATQGDIGFIDQSMSVYRITKKGIWTSLVPLAQRMATLESLVVGNALLDYRYRQMFDRSLVRYSASLGKEILLRAPWKIGLLFRVALLVLGHFAGMLHINCRLTRAFSDAMDRFVLAHSDTPQELSPTAPTTQNSKEG